MRSNLFVVCTPFNLLTTFILSKTIFKDDKNYLAIMHPQSYGQWEKEPILNYILSSGSVFKEVFLLLRWFRSGQGSYRKQIEAVKKMMDGIEFERIFLPFDLDEQAQLLVTVLGKTKFYRYDDGTSSYAYGLHSRSRIDSFFHKLKIEYICKTAGIKTNFNFNTKDVGASKEAVADYLYRPELLMRPSPGVVEITNDMIMQAFTELKDNNLIKQHFDKPTVLYLSQPIKQTKKAEEIEIAFLLKIMASLNEKVEFMYKPHARDNEEKVLKYKKAIPNLKVYESKTPAELLYISEPYLEMVIAHHSSALLFGEKFTGRKIRMVSFATGSKNKSEVAAMELMKKANVEFIK